MISNAKYHPKYPINYETPLPKYRNIQKLNGGQEQKKELDSKNLLKTGIQIFMTSLEDNTPSREILDMCNQLQANNNPKKTHRTMDELIRKYLMISKIKRT